jgi:hypothetical protein
MRKFLVGIVVALLSVVVLVPIPASGQALSEGSVVALQVLPNPLNGTFTWDFELCCGEPAGYGGFLGNGFAYVDGTFTAFYRYPGEKAGYSVTGTIGTWDTGQIVSKYCTVQSATLQEVALEAPTGKVTNNLVAEYSQLFCQRDGVYWLGGGGLTVHAR